MDPIDIYELHADADRNEVRIAKLQAMLRKVYRNGDANSCKKIEKHLSECRDLQKKLNEFFTNYIKQN